LVTTILIQGAVANPLDYNPAESPSGRLCGDPMLFGHSAGTNEVVLSNSSLTASTSILIASFMVVCDFI